jgi:endonuclease/exonuclease/phosphatase (EEP) superfamily protein YafD
VAAPPAQVPTPRGPDPDRTPSTPPEQRPAEAPARRRRGNAVILPLCALLLAAWAATCLVDVPNSALVGLATVCPAVGVLAIPVIAVAVHRRRLIIAGIAAAAAVLPWLVVAGYGAGGPGAAPARTDLGVRVLTVNAGEGQADAAQIVDAARSHQADVVVVTELTGTLAHDLTVNGIGTTLNPSWVNVDGPAAGGIGVWSRFDTQSVTPLTGTRLPAALIVLDTSAGSIRLLAAHVSPPSVRDARRWREDLRVIGDAGGGDQPRLVVGDLNATAWHAAFRNLSAAGLRDAADVLGHGLRNTWPQWAPVPLAALDHVLVGGGVGVRSVETLTVDGSDHRGLLVESTLRAPQGS